jgi:ABC-2 type transport system ATP-binding protein
LYAIETNELTRIFKPEGIVAVDNLTLKLKPGEIFAFLGPNGAGKTTTVRILSSLLKPTQGNAWIDGFEISEDPITIRKRIGILTDQPNIYERLTARRNLLYFAKMYEVPIEEAKNRIKEFSKLFGLSDRLDSPVSTYSKGMRQKLGLLRSIIHNPSIIFLDEPTSGLDPIATKTVRETIIHLTEATESTIFMTTHNLTEADKIADTIGVINNGKLLTLGSPDELKKQLVSKLQVSIDVLNPQKIQKQFISSISGVKDVSIAEKGNSIFITVDDYNNTVPNIVENFIKNGLRILQVKRVENTLEDVYMNIINNGGNNNEF